MTAEKLFAGKKGDWLICVALFCVTFTMFARVLSADFVALDDDQSVYRNPHVQGLDWERLCWMFADAEHAVRYKPLTWLSYALIYEVNGLNPFGYHLANLLFHSLDAALVFVLIRRLLAATRGAGADATTLAQLKLPAALGALLWSVNPLRVEPVARVTDVTYPLSFFFLLISLWFYLLMARQEGESRRRRIAFRCAVAAFAVCMFIYPFAFGYVIVLAALDWYPLRRWDPFSAWWRDAAMRRVAVEKISFLLLGGIVLVTYLSRINPAGIWTEMPSARHLSVPKQSVQAAYVLAYYVWRPWVPFHLSPIHTTLVWFNPRAWHFAASVLVVAATATLLWWKRRQWPWALVLGLSHAALLLSALGLTERTHIAGDRYDYMAALVWAVIVAAGLWKISRPRWRAMGMAAALALAVFWGGLSFQQTRIWKNSETLFNHVFIELEDRAAFCATVHGYLGKHYADQGRVREASEQFQLSLQAQPSAAGYYHLAMLLETNGAVEAAMTNYLKLLELHTDPLIHTKVAMWLTERARTAEAIAHYRLALAGAPDSVLVLNNLAWLLATAPDAADRNGAEAVALAERACALATSEVPLLVGTLAAAYAEAGRFKEAIETGQRAVALAQTAADPELAQRNRELLELYRAGRPYREARAASGPLAPPKPPAISR